jgi:hypothetical protein
MNHPKGDIARLYIKREEGRRGMVQVVTAYKADIIKIAKYLNKIINNTSL